MSTKITIDGTEHDVPDDAVAWVKIARAGGQNEGRLAIKIRNTDQLATLLGLKPEESKGKTFKDLLGLGKIAMSSESENDKITELESQIATLKTGNETGNTEKTKEFEDIIKSLKTDIQNIKTESDSKLNTFKSEQKKISIYNSIKSEANRLGLDKTAADDYLHAVSSRFDVVTKEGKDQFIYLTGDKADSYVLTDEGKPAGVDDIASMMKIIKPRDYVSPPPGGGTSGASGGQNSSDDNDGTWNEKNE